MKKQSIVVILLFTAFLALTIGCGNQITSVNAQTPVPFGGRYIFRAELHTAGQPNLPANFVEGGIINVDSNGGFTLTATYNANTDIPHSPINSPNVVQNGTYVFDSRGFGTMVSAGAKDAFSSNANFYCRHDGEYCTVESIEAGRAWQGKMWRDNSSSTSTLSTASFNGTYIFESDSSQNFFTESGVLTFDGSGKFTLQSAFNNTYPGSILGPPDKVWGCGEYSADSNSGHLTQRFCHDNSVTDTTAFYCANDASRCIGVPDLNEAGSWILEFQRQ